MGETTPSGATPPAPAPRAPRTLLLRGEAFALQDTLRSPLGHRPCLVYQTELSWVQRLREGRWHGPCRELAGVAFALRTQGRWLLVDPRRARVCWGTARRLRLRLSATDPEHLARLDALYRRLGRSRACPSVAAWERCLVPGDVVVVTGSLTELWLPQGTPDGYRAPPSMPLVVARALWPA